MDELIKAVDQAFEILAEQEDINMRSVALGLKLTVERARPIPPMIDMLLARVEEVTAYHRHGQKIPQRALDDLANYQIEVEKAMGKL